MSNLVVAIAILLLICCNSVFGASEPGVYNVRDFGAKIDGLTDDAPAIQAALDAAKAGPRGSVVLLPAGNYRVGSTITVENTLLKGLDAGGWCADRGPLPNLLVDFTDGPCVIAEESASIHGIAFDYDHRGEPARKFGPAILLAGNGISITNVRIHQPYEGIMADGESNIGRLNIENVFIVSARECGVYVANTLDIPTLRNVEVWNPSDYSIKHCVGFMFGRNDEIRLDNCFAFKCKIGYLFTRDEKGNTWGGMTGCSADYCVEGIVVEEATSLRISGGSLWCHSTSLRVDGPGKVVVQGVDFKANSAPGLLVNDCESITVTGCAFGKSADSWPDVPCVKLSGGKSVLINGCTFDYRSKGIEISENMNHISITNNVFQPSQFEPIVDNSSPTANKIIDNNLSMKTETSQ